MTKDKRGGARKGAGAKPLYNEPTKSVAFKVPLSQVDNVKKLVTEYLNQFKLPPTNDKRN